MRNFSGAVWVDLQYSGAEVWTQDAQAVNVTTNPWRSLADLTDVENIVGSGFSDYLAGNAQANTFFLTGGLDTIDGRGGVDTFNASAALVSLWIDLAYTGGAQVQTQDQDSLFVSGGTWRDVAYLSNVEIIDTTYSNDFVAGNDADNTFIM